MRFDFRLMPADWPAAASSFFSAQCLAQPYVGFSAGQADVDESMVIPGLIDPGGRVDGKDGAFKLFGGYQLNPNFALEAAFVDLGDVSYSGNFAGQSVTGGRIQNSGLNLSAVGVVPLGQSFVLFGKVGMFLWYSEATDVTGGFAFRSEEDGADQWVDAPPCQPEGEGDRRYADQDGRQAKGEVAGGGGELVDVQEEERNALRRTREVDDHRVGQLVRGAGHLARDRHDMAARILVIGGLGPWQDVAPQRRAVLGRGGRDGCRPRSVEDRAGDGGGVVRRGRGPLGGRGGGDRYRHASGLAV